jgi:hypothetical protein
MNLQTVTSTHNTLSDDLLAGTKQIAQFIFPNDLSGPYRVRAHAAELGLFKIGRKWYASKSEINAKLSSKQNRIG